MTDDREMKYLMDCMETSAGTVINAHQILNDPEEDNAEILDLAEKLKDEHALRLARLYRDFIKEIIGRRQATGNFQYPFDPFDEWGVKKDPA